MKHFKQLFVFALMTLFSVGAWGAEYQELFTIQSSSIAGSSYASSPWTYDDGDNEWIITFGGNNVSVGTNSGNRSNCNLSNNAKYAVSPVTTSSVASAFVSTTSVSDVCKISYTFNGGSNQTSTKVYLIYSSDNTTFSQITLTSGTQGATISSGAAFEFAKCSGYFGLLFEATNSSGNWRIDNVVVTFYTEATKTLSSITISGTPDKDTYEEGELFDPTGLVATGYYDDSSDEDLTSSVVWAYTPAGALTQGLTSVNVTATKGTIVGNKDVDITVNAHVVTPDEYEIPTNNALWGTSYNGSAGVTTLSGTKHDISITINKNTGSGMYVNDAQTRIYNGYTMVFSVPSGYVITAIQFTADGGNWAGEHTADVGTMTDNKNWSGSSNTVTISIAGTCRMTAVTVTFEAEAADAPSVTISPVAVDATAAAVADGLIDATYENIALASVAVGLYNDAECNETFTDGWLTASLNGDKDIAYTLTENTGAARTAYIKLTAPASNGTSPDVVKIIEVSQAKGIPTYTALNAIFAAATGTDETVKVTFNNWVISALRGTANAYLTDGTYGLIIYTEDHGFNVGDVLSGTVQTTLTKFQGNAELKGVTATSDGLTVTPGGTISARVLDAAGAAELTGANAGSLIKISGECTEPTTGRYYINGIQLYNSLYSYETPTVGDVYDCTGIFVMYNSYKEILPRQDGDLVPSAVTPTAIITFEDFSIEKGQNTTLAATVAPAVAASAEVTYSIVDGGEYVSLADDVLTATEVGTAHIRATVADGAGYYGNTKEITVTVTAPDSRYTAIIEGITAINGTLVTETAGTHKDKEYISYAAQKGNASNAPIIPSGKSFVRIYQNGGYLALNAVKGCVIDEVIVSIPTGCNSTTIAVGTDEENLPTTGGTAATAGNDFSTGTGLNSQNVYLVCLGTTSSTRLEVGSITVKYTGDPIEVSSIAVGGTYQTEFEKNETFNHDGLVVTATYTDASVADVTALAEFSDPDMTTLGVKTVTVSYGGKSTTYNIEVVAAALSEIQLSGTYPTQFAQGDEFSHAGIIVTAVYSDASEVDVTGEATFAGYDMSGAGVQMVTVSYGGKEATYSILVVPENTDVLTAAGIAAEGSSYTDWSNKTFSTSAKYAGHSFAGNTDAIQIRTSGSVEGIVVTAQNGTKVVKSVTVNFATAPSGTRKLQVYGKHSAYSTAADLFSAEADTQGELIGELAADGTVDCTAADYEFIGIRSYDGAMYLASVMITWGDATPAPDYEDVRTGLTIGKYYTICYPKAMTAIKGGTLWSFIGKDENTAYIQQETAPFDAGKPYIMCATAEKFEAIFEGDDAAAGSNNGLYGTLNDMDATALATAGATHMLYNNEVSPIGTDNHLNANRAYIILANITGGKPAGMPAHMVRSVPMHKDVITGMDELNASETPVKVLINGQLFILRGEKMYNANGQLVK